MDDPYSYEGPKFLFRPEPRISQDQTWLEGAELLDDRVSGEVSDVYDMEDPPMEVGTIYASMNEFRAAVRQHAINGQIELGTINDIEGSRRR